MDATRQESATELVNNWILMSWQLHRITSDEGQNLLLPGEIPHRVTSDEGQNVLPGEISYRVTWDEGQILLTGEISRWDTTDAEIKLTSVETSTTIKSFYF